MNFLALSLLEKSWGLTYFDEFIRKTNARSIKVDLTWYYGTVGKLHEIHAEWTKIVSSKWIHAAI